MKTISLTQGKFALVDDEDFEWLSQWKWHFHHGYVKRVGQSRETILMHREIVQTPKDLYTDHIDHNKLNNQKNNLRVCSAQQNSRNKLRSSTKSDEYKGTQKAPNCWQAHIYFDTKSICLGSYDSEEDAAIAYNHAALKYYGEYAYFNSIENWKNRFPERRVHDEGLRTNNTTGYKCISWDKFRNKWFVEVKHKKIGRFLTLDEAIAARDAALRDGK